MDQESINIKVTIAGRVYRLSVGMEEEEHVRRGARMIEEHLNELRSSYAVQDPKDLLAMTALRMASERSRLERELEEGGQEGSEALQSIEDRIEEFLREKSSD